jgi:hypothetical protein
VLDVGWLSYVDGLTIGIIAVSLAVRVIPLITEDSPRDSPYGPADERPLQSIISLMAHDPTDDGASNSTQHGSITRLVILGILSVHMIIQPTD